MHRTVWVVTLALVIIPITHAAERGAPLPPAGSPEEALAPLQPFAGEWTGEGWIAFPPGERTLVRTATKCGFLGGGAFFLIEEQAWGRLEGPDKPETRLHNAVTTFFYDPAAKAAAVRLFEVSIGDAEGVVTAEPDAVMQVYAVPGRGQFRLTMLKTDTGWLVQGHESQDGGIWTQNLEVGYRRAGGVPQ